MLTQAGLTGRRINSTHGPARGSLHFNRCGCAGLGAARQCGNASGQEREVRPAIRTREGSSTSTSNSSDCHLPLPTSTPPTTSPPPQLLPTQTPTPTPTVPTAGSHAPRSSPSANVSSSHNTNVTISNSCDQPRPTTIPAAAAQAATGAINTASRAGLLHPGHSGTCALHHLHSPSTLLITRDCPRLYRSV